MQIMPSINTNAIEDNIKKLNQDKNMANKLKEDQQLKDVCQEFESIFINMMLKAGRDTVEDGGLIKKDNGTKMFEDMHDQELSIAMSKSQDGGIGIGKMLYEQMKMGLNYNRPKFEDIESRDNIAE